MADLFTPLQPPPRAFAHVAVEQAIDRYPDGLTYAVPDALTDLSAGQRVRVPLGRGDHLVSGTVIDVMTSCDLPVNRIKTIDRREDVAALPRDLISLAKWISAYYLAPIGPTLAAMLPAPVKQGTGRKQRLFVDLPSAEDAADGAAVADAAAAASEIAATPTRKSGGKSAGKPAEKKARLSPAQRTIIEWLATLPESDRPVDARDVAAACGVGTIAPLRRMVERGLLVASQRTGIEATWMDPRVDARAPEHLTDGQRDAVKNIGAALGRGFSAHLLYGVTGSGKTEVYVRLIERALSAGRAALVLVPEISLTPQTGSRLLGRFPGARVAILHSALSAAQRHQQWDRVLRGEAEIILGARSAIFAPIANERLGLIIVDEEHDGSYKQDQMPRYHGRDVALRRGQEAGCPVVLGSATPSLESWHNAVVRNRFSLHVMPNRAPGMRLPHVEVVDLAAERRTHNGQSQMLLGPRLRGALEQCLRDGGQAMLLLNRRGFANYIMCANRTCGWVMQCDHCDVTSVFHRQRDLPRGGFVRCHHCLTETRLPESCPTCSGRLILFGLGTQRVEEELERRFPELRTGMTMLRVDSDTMRSSRDLHEALDRFGSGEVRVLLGTQMIAKGLDFPQVRLVGVINADTAANMPDFRASERTFQLVSQVAGRSGRTSDPRGLGRVIVQSFHPEMPAIQLAAAHDFPGFARMELEDRAACGLPPYTRLARIVCRDADPARALAAATTLMEKLAALAAPDIRLRGPAPCPIPRIADRARIQIEIIAPGPAQLQQLLAEARATLDLHSDAATAIDVDPVSLM